MCPQQPRYDLHCWPLLCLRTPAPFHDALQALGSVPLRLGPYALIKDLLVEPLHQFDMPEQFLEGQYLPQEYAKGVHIRGEGIAPTEPDLGGHVPGRAADFVQPIGIALDALGKTKVEQLHHAP